MVSEDAEYPRTTLFLPEEISIPERDFINRPIIKEFVPEEYCKYATEMRFFHERSHFTSKEAREANNVRNKLLKEKRQLENKMEEINSAKGKEKLRLILGLIDEQGYMKKIEDVDKKIEDIDEKIEIIANRQMLNETPNLDAIVAMALVEPMFGEGLVGARVVLNPIRKLQRKEITYEQLIKGMISAFQKKFPRAHQKTLEKLAKGYLRIGEEIREKFDAWEKKNIKKPED